MDLPAQQKLVFDIIGPSFAGALVYEVLYGVAASMAWNYFDYCQDDSLTLKVFVGWSIAAGAAQAALLFHYMWYSLIACWGDINRTLGDAPLSGILINVSTLFIVVPSQIFFASIAFRSLGKNYIFLGIIGIGILVVTAAGLGTCINLLFLHETYNSAPLFPNMYLWTIAAVEVITASVLIWRFRNLQSGAGEESRNLLSRFIFLSLRTSSATTVCALVNRILSVSGHGLIGQAPGNFLGAVILISVLHTLNSRKRLYLKNKTSENTSNGAPTQVRATNNHGGKTEVRVDTIVLRHMDGGAIDEGSAHSSRLPISEKAATQGPFNQPRKVTYQESV